MAYWMNASWPASVGQENDHAFWEDIRKWIWLIDHQRAGLLTFNPYSWSEFIEDLLPEYDPDIIFDPGDLVLRDEKDHNKAYKGNWHFVNKEFMNLSAVANHPPVKGDGTFDAKWRLSPNPNKYHHWDYNSCRWEIEYHTSSAGSCVPYAISVPAHKWLPQHTDPYEQKKPHGNSTPGKEFTGQGTQVFWPFEIKKRHVTQNLETQWTRTHPTGGTSCPIYLTEYVKSGGEPKDESVPSQSYYDPKMCEAYQDRVQFLIEHHTEFVRLVTDEFKEFWTKWQGLNETLWGYDNFGSEWFEDAGHEWTECQIVYLPGADWFTSVKYTCKQDHFSILATKPPNATYWYATACQPTHCPLHPVYERLGHGLFGFNGSAFENMLDVIGQYDWWWDDNPYIPKWLSSKWLNDNVPGWTRAEFPIPAGCWRRTWRTSMGRVDDVMLPKEAGAPFSLYSLTPWQMIIDPSQYGAIRSGFEWLFQTHDVAAMKVSVASKLAENNGEYEGYLEARHDPVQEAFSDEYEGSITRLALNDMYEVLSQLQTAIVLDTPDVLKDSYVTRTDGPLESTPAEASAAITAQVMNYLPCSFWSQRTLRYYAGDWIQKAGVPWIYFSCTVEHQPSPDTEPDVGGSWNTVWQYEGAAGRIDRFDSDNVNPIIQDTGIGFGTWQLVGYFLMVKISGGQFRGDDTVYKARLALYVDWSNTAFAPLENLLVRFGHRGIN